MGAESAEPADAKPGKPKDAKPKSAAAAAAKNGDFTQDLFFVVKGSALHRL